MTGRVWAGFAMVAVGAVLVGLGQGFGSPVFWVPLVVAAIAFVVCAVAQIAP